MSLAVIGPLPPPAGGVTIHAQRLVALLEQRRVAFRFYDLAQRRRLSFWRDALLLREPAVYVLSPRLEAWLYAAALARLRGKRVAVRIQNSRLVDWQRSDPLRARLAGAALRSLSAVVCVNRDIAATVAALGVAPDRIHCVPGFLPPAAGEIDQAAVAPMVASFVASHEPVIAANGRVSWHDGDDLYGLDLLVELAARLRPAHPNVGVVACLYDVDARSARYLDELRERARARGVDDHVLFHTEPGPFVSVVAQADLFVRPTNTDGDANSLREALALGVPAVASDAALRPEGTALFRSRDAGGLADSALRELATARRDRTRRAAPVVDQARVDAYLDLLGALAAGYE